MHPLRLSGDARRVPRGHAKHRAALWPRGRRCLTCIAWVHSDGVPERLYAYLSALHLARCLVRLAATARTPGVVKGLLLLLQLSPAALSYYSPL